MPVSGRWLQDRRAQDPQYAVNHEVDPAHGVPGIVENSTTPGWHAPPYQEVEPAPPEVGMEWVTDVPGIVLPYPHPGHDQPSPHSVDDGGADARNRSDVRFQFSDERYELATAEGQPGSVSAISETVLRRGMNAEGQNNPPDAAYGGEGFRRGQYRWPTMNRIFSPPWRRHDFRIVTPNVVTPQVDAAPPDRPGPYNSPFSSLARAIRNLNPKPTMRRIPEPIDEAVITDGSEAVPVFMDTWVTG